MHTVSFRFARRPLLRLLGSFCLFAALASVAAAKPVKFDIPAQPTADALIAFSKQSGLDVLYSYKDLKDVMSPAVTGDYEPDEAIGRLLKDTGFSATRDGGKFVVAKGRVVTTGSIRGSLALPNGQPAAGVWVTVRETSQATATDDNGEFFLRSVPAGAHLLVVRAEGYQPLHLTDVNVHAGHELSLSRESLRKADEVAKLEPYVVHAEALTELDKYSVTGSKEKPFAMGNLDIPRTRNDVQPYYIFDAATIESSGATNIEDLLKQRLTMNATLQTNSQSSSSTSGNTSSINLRGVGADKTLILVDGRRRSGFLLSSTDAQPDLNGIALDMIERIEVLPSSASGIYGGGAIGGVVNIITKRNYQGGEIRATYDNTFDTDSARRTVSASYGWSLEGGRTHLTISGSWSDAHELLMQDRLDQVRANFATIMRNSPSFMTTAFTMWRGTLPNITTTSASLVLKGGVSLNSQNTYIPAGTSASSPAATLAGGLKANAGQWDMDFPTDTNPYTGGLRTLGSFPRTRSFEASLRRQMLPWLEVYADFSVNEIHSAGLGGTGNTIGSVPATAPTNPFTTAVQVVIENPNPLPLTADVQSGSLSTGFLAQLPAGWTGTLDYTRSQTRYRGQSVTVDSSGLTSALTSGVLNPFVDQSLYPLDLSKYLPNISLNTRTLIDDFTVKAAGRLPALPWGQPNLATGLEHRLERAPASRTINDYAVTTANSYQVDYYPRRSVSASGYAEALVPLVKMDWLPGVHVLELQAAGRVERYTVNTGTTSKMTYFERSPVVTTYNGAVQNGQPYFSDTSYQSVDHTLGLKYQPVKDITLRASWATAFLPPTMAQLAETQDRTTTTTNVNDPKTGKPAAVYTRGGGNADLKPQRSTSTNVGFIWEPSWKPLQGLRLDAEYYKIAQFDAISTLSAQQIVSQESLYPDRVTRDASGNITLVNISNLNLYSRETEGWDLSASYTRKTAIGTFRLDAIESIVTHLKTQYSQTAPAYDAVNFPSEGGSVKYKANATLAWDWRNWTASWTTRYYGRYQQYGAAGGPASIQSGGGADYLYFVGGQGGQWVDSQIFHDAFAGYAFGRNRTGRPGGLRGVGAGMLDGLTVQLGVRNVFNAAPAMDVYYGTTLLFMSPYGDPRLRSYWLSVKKAF